ncbi:MAG TPA: hypothetical protein VFN67_06175 [Polyangiales bacterium]|nr:hypothetical protein [Polyangiales bacterium]
MPVLSSTLGDEFSTTLGRVADLTLTPTRIVYRKQFVTGGFVLLLTMCCVSGRAAHGGDCDIYSVYNGGVICNALGFKRVLRDR